MATIAQLLAGNTVGQLKSQTSARLADWWKRFSENTIVNEFARKAEDVTTETGETAEKMSDAGTAIGSGIGAILDAITGGTGLFTKGGATLGRAGGAYIGTQGAQEQLDALISEYEGYRPLEGDIENLRNYDEILKNYILGGTMSEGVTQYAMDPKTLGIKTPSGDPSDWSVVQKLIYGGKDAPTGNVTIKDFINTPGSELQFSPGAESVIPSDLWEGYTTDAAKNISSLGSSATINPDYTKALAQTPTTETTAPVSVSPLGNFAMSMAPTILKRLTAGGWDSPWVYQAQRGRNNLRY